MKDVTVCLELTLPGGVSDQEIKSFVESAIKEKLFFDRFDKMGQDMEKHDWHCNEEGILGIYEPMIDAVAIHDGAFTTGDCPPVGFRELGDRW